jgi:hypothetical protein
VIETIPEGFLSRLLRAFGIQWTHLVIISGVVFSSFRLEEYLNPGVWILGTVAAFALAYLFRQHIPGNFPKVFLWCITSMLVAIAAPIALLLHAAWQLGPFLKVWTIPATAYLSLAIGVPLGLIILSYRAQEEFLRTPLPKGILRAVRDWITHSDFIHERVAYEISLIPHGSDVVMRFHVTMDLLNRRKEAIEYRDIFDPAGDDKRFPVASINGEPVDTGDPDRLSLRGLHLSYRAKAHERFQVIVSGESTFHGRDSELVGVYFPCDSMSVLLKKPPEGLRVNIQSLVPVKIDPKTLDCGDIVFQCPEGVLPFQGARIFWELRHEPGASVRNHHGTVAQYPV